MDSLVSLNENLPRLKKDWSSMDDFAKELTVGSVCIDIDRCDRIMTLTPESVLQIFAKSELNGEDELVQKVMFRLRLWRSIS